MGLLGILLSSLIIGALARLALPGRDPMPIWMTLLIGFVGALVGGFVGDALFGSLLPIVAIQVLVATGIVYLVRRRRGEAVLARRPLR